MGFLCETLSSGQLLRLLFECECRRKGLPADENAWQEFSRTFEERLQNLGEEARAEVLNAHLMSVEDVDVYDDETMRKLLQ